MDNHQELSRAFLKQRDTLLSYIRALVRDVTDVEDIFQEVGVKVLSHDSLACPIDKFPAWCRGVARNEILHYWRKQRRNHVIANDRLWDILDVAYVEADPQAEQYRMRAAALAACLETVPEQQRRLLDLRYANRHTSEQIGRVVNRSADAIRQELRRLRSLLQQCIDRRLQVEASHDA